MVVTNPEHMPPHREGPITSLFKLIEVCKRGGRTFDAAGKFASNSSLRQLAVKLANCLTRFRFELREESRRLDKAQNGLLDNYDFLNSKDNDELNPSCEESMDYIVAEYRSVLGAHMPPHTRAMVRRQCTELEVFRDELDRVIRAA